mmetsp:Transcript_6836/g.19718  ORF Transcript_6836/g.19718 Transcript_6836/m.19718 type:complete len:221 (-) Transcript_6836:7410-8072(-)
MNTLRAKTTEVQTSQLRADLRSEPHILSQLAPLICIQGSVKNITSREQSLGCNSLRQQLRRVSISCGSGAVYQAASASAAMATAVQSATENTAVEAAAEVGAAVAPSGEADEGPGAVTGESPDVIPPLVIPSGVLAASGSAAMGCAASGAVSGAAASLGEPAASGAPAESGVPPAAAARRVGLLVGFVGALVGLRTVTGEGTPRQTAVLLMDFSSTVALG